MTEKTDSFLLNLPPKKQYLGNPRLMKMEVMKQTKKKEDNVNWFNRHLNWSYIFAYCFLCLLSFILGFAIGVFAPETSDAAFDVMGYVLTTAIMLPVSIVIIKAKGRSLWWLLLAGWFSPLWLSNKRHTFG